jgi:hypothetical protein
MGIEDRTPRLGWGSFSGLSRLFLLRLPGDILLFPGVLGQFWCNVPNSEGVFWDVHLRLVSTLQMDDEEADMTPEISEQERHAIAHAQHQVDRASPEKPECSFDYELVATLLRVISRSSEQIANTQSDLGAAFRRNADIEFANEAKIKAARQFKDRAEAAEARLAESVKLFGEAREALEATGLSWPERMKFALQAITMGIDVAVSGSMASEKALFRP